MENNSKPGDLIYDPFGGSGTTLIAAEITGRRAALMEIAPVYVDVIVRRWKAFTGREATLADTGKTFAQARRERGVPDG
jgi:DNA modification methylase